MVHGDLLRQILTSKVDPRILFIMAVDPYHRFSNKSKLTKIFRGFNPQACPDVQKRVLS